MDKDNIIDEAVSNQLSAISYQLSAISFYFFGLIYIYNFTLCLIFYQYNLLFMRNFLTLEIWKRSHQLTLKIYKITKCFPKEELFGLSSQMRRSASSIPTNIAEGCGRNSNPQLANFLQIASGSCSEIQYQIILCKELLYITEEVFNELHSDVVEIRKMIFHYSCKL